MTAPPSPENMSQYFFSKELVFAIENDIFLSTCEDKTDREKVACLVCRRIILLSQMRLHIAFHIVSGGVLVV